MQDEPLKASVRITFAVKTALLTTSLVLLLVAATGVWQYRRLSNEYVSLIRVQQQHLAELAAGDLNYKLSMHLAVLAREARTTDPAVFEQAELRQGFLQRIKLRPLFDGTALIDLAGHVVLDDPPSAKVLNIADRSYFQQARDEGIAAISGPLQARTNGQPAILMVAPIKAEGNRVVGVLAAGLNLNRPNVLGTFAHTRAANGSYYVIETTGPRPVYVVHPDARQVMQAVAPSSASAVDGAARDLRTSARIPVTDWTLRVVLPAEAAYAPLAAARSALLTQMFLLALVCSALVWAGTTWLLRPLARLHKAIRVLRHSPDTAVALDVRAKDERGDLAREFDALMGELRTKRSEMAAVTDASPSGLFRCDAEGRMVYVNDEYLAIHGLDRADAAEGWLDLVSEASRQRVWYDWAKRVRADQPFHATRWLHRRDGRDVLVALHMRPLLVEGRVVGQVGTVADITERNHAEQALRTLSTIFEATTDFVVQLDKTGRLTYMNPAARLVGGLAADAPIAHLTMADFNPPSTVERLRTEVVPTAAAKGVWVGESIVWDAARQPFPVSHMVIAHRDKNGHIERFSGIMRDISAAKSTERALSESEARLRTIADALPMRVAYIDAAERYQFVNLAYEGVFGVTRDSIPGRTIRELFGEARYPTIERHIRAALAENASRSRRGRNRRPVCLLPGRLHPAVRRGRTQRGGLPCGHLRHHHAEARRAAAAATGQPRCADGPGQPRGVRAPTVRST
ncbi:MAG: PAS domain S-box protein [Variovorax sp.]